MRHRTLAPGTLALGVAALAALAPEAHGQTFYASRAAFLADPGVTTTTAIDFDAFLPGTDLTGSTLSGVTLNAPGSGPLAVILGSTGVRFAMNPSSGLNVLSPGGSTPSAENDDLELLFATPVRAAGLDVVFDVADGASFARVTFFDGAGAALCSRNPFNSPIGGPRFQFLGCVSPTANIARVLVDDFDPSPNDDNIAYDSIVFSPAAVSAVPEPATVALVALGLVAIPVARRRRRG